MNETQQILYACEAHNKSPKDAALFFAREYWAQPRKVCKWNAEKMTFSVVNGTRVYQVELAKENLGKSPAIYRVIVNSETK